jgi:hypothetical protein
MEEKEHVMGTFRVPPMPASPSALHTDRVHSPHVEHVMFHTASVPPFYQHSLLPQERCCEVGNKLVVELEAGFFGARATTPRVMPFERPIRMYTMSSSNSKVHLDDLFVFDGGHLTFCTSIQYSLE